jgi:ankyrin repeat protein
VSPDYWYDDPHHATCLYLTCKEDDGAEYARALLDNGADPNNLNGIRKKAAIHVAAESARDEVLKILLSNSCIDINIKDGSGNTPLHLIAKQELKDTSADVVNKYKYCIQLLMNQDRINLNIRNRKGYTAIHLAAQDDAKEVVETILEHAGDDLDIDNLEASNGKSARETIIQKYPELAELLPEQVRAGDRKQTVDSSTLFHYLYHRNCGAFIAAIDVLPRSQLENNDGSRSLLQYCAENGLERETSALLDKGVNPNATCPAEPRPPALLACYGGHPSILKLFLRLGPESVELEAATGEGGTALHAVLTCPRADTSIAHRDYKTCLDLLLKYLPDLKIDINASDLKGNTALHYAAKNKDDDAVLTLLKHGAYIGIKNVFGEPPLASMSPKILETFLNDCLNTIGEFPREDTYQVKFSYKFLVPPAVQSCMQDQHNSHVPLTLPLHNTQRPNRPPSHNNSMEMTNTETDPLVYISHSRDLKYLLKHPVLTSFLDLKWHRIRIFFYINLIFYILFVALLTFYILLSYGKPHVADSNNDSHNTSTVSSSATAEYSTVDTLTLVKSNASGFWWAVLVVFFILLLLREMFQLVAFPSKYFRSPENYLEVLLLVTSAAILFSDGVRRSARPHFSAIAILLSWAELVLLIGRHPRLSTNIEMFKTVSWNFLKFLAWYAILIVAFALSFYSLFRDCGDAAICGEEGDSEENFFLDPGMSVFKTVVMLTGEFDTASIPFVSFPGTSHVVFVLFIFLIAIVLFNLLNGLAVSDTQAIRDDAEVVSYMSRVMLISYIETLFQSSSFPFARTLKRICCCWPTSVHSLKSITSRVRLFPNKVPYNYIRVLPNQGRRIIFSNDQEKFHEIEENTSRCCLNGCGGCTLDPGILKKAMEIINDKALFAYNQKKLEEYERRFDSMEKSWKVTEDLLNRILNTLQNSSSNTSLKI